MKQKFINSIKIISSILITGALGLDIWCLSSLFCDRTFPNILYPVVWIANIALVIHLIAGIIAAIIANTLQKSFFTYGIYTFFVGFVGLWELHQISSDPKKQA
jgi:ABC-type polysaccharide transport system permease subunit